MSDNKSDAEKKPGKKRAAPKTAWKPGQSGNPKGAPKRGLDWRSLIKEYGDMTPAEAAARSLELSKQFLKIGEGVTLKEAVVMRIYGSLLFEPTAGLVNAIMNREDGMPPQDITSGGKPLGWRERVKEAGFDPDEIDAMAVEVVRRQEKQQENTGE